MGCGGIVLPKRLSFRISFIEGCSKDCNYHTLRRVFVNKSNVRVGFITIEKESAVELFKKLLSRQSRFQLEWLAENTSVSWRNAQ